MLLEAFRRIVARPRILVLGDIMLDRYTSGRTNRISQEAPVLVLRSEQCENRLGGAASVAHMLSALNSEVICMGVCGADEPGLAMRSLMASAGIDHHHVVCEPDRPTSLKQRFVGRSGSGLPSQVLRVDTESNQPLASESESQLTSAIREIAPKLDAIIISDYAKGVCTPALTQAVIQLAKTHSIPVLVDPGRDRDVSLYRGATLVKPNRAEAELAIKRPITNSREASEAGRKLCIDHDLDMTVITLDSDGMCLVQADGAVEFVATMARSVFDITGAGDMVISVLGLCFASGLDASLSVRLANTAAGLEVDRAGVAVLSRGEIEHELTRSEGRMSGKQLSLEHATRLAETYRQQGRRIVFTNGCFDLLHVGHVSYLEEARDQGDLLIVGVNSDSSVRRLKGPSRPVISESDRAAMLSALACVDHVVVFESDTPCDLLRAIRPDILVKGGTYSREEVVGYEIVESYGGEIRLMDVIEGVSTTRIISSLESKTEYKRAS